MGKFRSKLKSHVKGKTWARGHSATSNPINQKHRSKAKSRFFQANLSLAQSEVKPKGSLTLEAVLKHDARQSYVTDKEKPTVNDISQSLKSFNMDGGDMTSNSQGASSIKTFQTFASNYSSCTNVSFNKLLTRFRSDSTLHKEMLAILAGITDIIKDRGGTQSSTEYFLGLLEVLESVNDDNHLIAALSLLAMGIKTVPQAVLRKKFSETGELLLEIMQRFIEVENQSVWRHIIGCMSVLLRNQEYSVWSLPSTLKYFDSILVFTIHSRPKIRKAAQHGVASILRASCFMLPLKDSEGEENMIIQNIKHHPASNHVTKFCVNQFKPENIAHSQTVILHVLGVLQEIISVLKYEDIKIICENLLSIMTAANILIRTNCFQTIHALFSSKTTNLNAVLTGKLISAIYEYRPDRHDMRQTLAWITVLKQGHIFLAETDQLVCSNALPKLVEICATDLWISEKIEIVTGTSNVLKEIFYDCIQPCCSSLEESNIHRSQITKIIQSISKALTAPFGHIANQVMLTFKVVFEVCGKYFSDVLLGPLAILGDRYDSHSSYRVQIEHAILAAVATMGPANVLKAIPLTDEAGNVSLNRSWLLPLLREAIINSTFEFFANHILKLAADCNIKWKRNREEKNIPIAHTYELLCCQLWSLFPGFCRNPKDPQNFRYIAKTLGTVLNENPELRSPVLDGLKELCLTSNEEMKDELQRFAKNFQPRLLNIYTTKPTGTYEAEQRELAFEVIKAYLELTPTEVKNEMFETAMEQLKTLPAGTFLSEAIFDTIKALALYQTADKLENIYENYMTVILQKKQKKASVATEEGRLCKQQKKTYLLLHDILSSDNKGCVEFVNKQKGSIRKLLLSTFEVTSKPCQGVRLTCLKKLFEKQKKLSIESPLVRKSIPECVLALGSFGNCKENVAEELFLSIADMYAKENKLNDLIDLLISGFAGDSILITNTILVLKVMLQHYYGSLTVTTIQFMLEQVKSFLTCKQRNEAEASVNFLMTFVKVLPVPLIGNHLSDIVKGLSAMVPDTKRYCRVHLGFLYKKLCKKFTAEEIIKFVPGNDEGTHKRLKKIKKDQARIRRQRMEENRNKQKNDSDDSDVDDDEIIGNRLEKKTDTIEDILADSSDDSDFEKSNREKNVQMSKNKKNKSKTFIKEDPESIVDLADLNSVGKITTSRPEADETKDSGLIKKPKDPNRGFKMAVDGRLIIDENENYSSGGNDSDDDVMDDEKGKTNGSKRLLPESSSDEEDELPTGPSRKRKALDSLSMVTGKTGASSASKYQAGGKGIHRPIVSSVKSGISGKSFASKVSLASTKASGVTFGNEYKPKKAKGDMKQKGKLDPYAYIPLSKSNLNKRKRAKNAGQFKSIVKGARKGAAAGSKMKLIKTPRNT